MPRKHILAGIVTGITIGYFTSDLFFPVMNTEVQRGKKTLTEKPSDQINTLGEADKDHVLVDAQESTGTETTETTYLQRLQDLMYSIDYESSVSSLMTLLRLNRFTSLNYTQRRVAIEEAIQKMFNRLLSEGISPQKLATTLEETKTLEGFRILGLVLAESAVEDGLKLINTIENEDEALWLSQGFFAKYFADPTEESAFWSDWIESNLDSNFQNSAYSSLSQGYATNEKFEDAFVVLEKIGDPTLRLNFEGALLYQVGSIDPARALKLIRNNVLQSDRSEVLYTTFFQKFESESFSKIRSFLNDAELQILDSLHP